MTGLDPEQMYHLLQQKDWSGFLGLLHSHRAEIAQNPVAGQATMHFLPEFLEALEQDRTGDFINEAETLYLLHVGRMHTLGAMALQTVVNYHLRVYRAQSLKKAYDFAKNHTDNTLASKIVNEYLESRPRVIPHTLEDRIQLTCNNQIRPVDYTIPLFKSQQEREFFFAVRDTFPNYHTYPNVAVSSLLDFDKLKLDLSSNQRDYFLKAIVDCVVFDPQQDSYRPLYFFEVDSHYHDCDEQRLKDGWKDYFFGLAGKELLRVRAGDRTVGRQEFHRLLKAIIS